MRWRPIRSSCPGAAARSALPRCEQRTRATTAHQLSRREAKLHDGELEGGAAHDVDTARGRAVPDTRRRMALHRAGGARVQDRFPAALRVFEQAARNARRSCVHLHREHDGRRVRASARTRSMAAERTFQIEVVYAHADEQAVITLRSPGTTVEQAIRLSGLPGAIRRSDTGARTSRDLRHAVVAETRCSATATA